MNVANPLSVLVLGLAILMTGLLSLALAPRGGRFRALPGWSGFWTFFGVVLVLLSRTPWWVSFPLLGLIVLASLREYFYLAPVRPQDRWAILIVYLSVPVTLYPVVIDELGAFMTAILIFLFLILPTGLSLGTRHDGLLDSMGRVLLAVLVFVLCGGHLAWMTHESVGHLELFGTLVIVSEFPQRVAGRLRMHNGVLRSIVGVVVSFVVAAAAGTWLAPVIGVTPRMGLCAGILVWIGVTAAGIVTSAVAHDLSLTPQNARFGRAALLDRIAPAFYAAPLYYHFLDYFA